MITEGKSRIAGAGDFIPNIAWHSDDLMKEAHSTHYGMPIDFISRILGIEERRCAEDMDVAELAIHASRSAIRNAGIDVKDIDMVLFCGIQGLYQEPSTAHIVQRELGCVNATCFDISNACLGLMSGVMTANAFIGSGGAENILVTSGERGSEIIKHAVRQCRNASSKEEFNRLVGGLTVGDAGGAFVLTKKTDKRGFNWFNTISHGELAELCWYKHDGEEIKGEIDIGNISTQCIEAHRRIMPKTYELMDWDKQDVDILVAHQVGIRPHKKLARAAGISVDKAPITHRDLGNLASASLAPVYNKANPLEGNKTLFLASASGISVGQAGHID